MNVLLATYVAKKTIDAICKETGIQTKSKKEKEKYSVAIDQACLDFVYNSTDPG